MYLIETKLHFICKTKKEGKPSLPSNINTKLVVNRKGNYESLTGKVISKQILEDSHFSKTQQVSPRSPKIQAERSCNFATH